jgi:nitroreductase
VCPCGIFQAAENNGIPAVSDELSLTCIRCGQCISACPGDAISVKGLEFKDFLPLPITLPSLNDFTGLVKSRRSIRNFKPEQIDVARLKELLEVARFAPTAKNSQALSWILINGREKVRNFSAAVIDAFRVNERMAALVEDFDRGGDPVHRGAPHVAVAYGPENYPWGTMDAAIAVSYMELAAKAAGFGSCWGGFSTWAASGSREVGKSIGLSEKEKIFAVIMLGYPGCSYHSVPARKSLNLRII